MRLSISKIKQQPAATLRYQLTDEQLDPAAYGYSEFRFAAPLVFDGQATNRGGGLFEVTGGYQTSLQLICSRCLNAFTLPLSGEIKALYGSSPEEETEGELAVHSFSGDNIDLDELLLSEINFALPMQPLCKEDCRGLCPECGTDLNHGACSCAKEQIDPRWEKLAYFKFNGDE